MNTRSIFISHASKDDEFIKQLRLALEGQGLTVWVDSRNLRGGHKLAPEIEKAIEEARQVIVVLRACEKIGFFVLYRHLGQVLVRLRASATLSDPLCRLRRACLDLPHPPS